LVKMLYRLENRSSQDCLTMLTELTLWNFYWDYNFTGEFFLSYLSHELFLKKHQFLFFDNKTLFT